MLKIELLVKSHCCSLLDISYVSNIILNKYFYLLNFALQIV